MTTPQNLYSIAAGWNVPAVSLTQISTVIAPGDTITFPAPQSRGFFDTGKRDVRTDGSDYYRGSPATVWFWPVLSWNQYYYLYNTPLAASYFGKCTVLTRVGFDAFTRYNCWFRLPKQVETDGKFFAPKKVKCDLMRLVLSS